MRWLTHSFVLLVVLTAATADAQTGCQNASAATCATPCQNQGYVLCQQSAGGPQLFRCPTTQWPVTVPCATPTGDGRMVIRCPHCQAAVDESMRQFLIRSQIPVVPATAVHYAPAAPTPLCHSNQPVCNEAACDPAQPCAQQPCKSACCEQQPCEQADCGKQTCQSEVCAPQACKPGCCEQQPCQQGACVQQPCEQADCGKQPCRSEVCAPRVCETRCDEPCSPAKKAACPHCAARRQQPLELSPAEARPLTAAAAFFAIRAATMALQPAASPLQHTDHQHQVSQEDDARQADDAAEQTRFSREELAQIAQQKICPVNGEPLDSMGGPIKIEVAGQVVFVCCEGCREAVMDDPQSFLTTAR